MTLEKTPRFDLTSFRVADIRPALIWEKSATAYSGAAVFEWQ